MWKDKLKEIIYILENSNVNEIDLSFCNGIELSKTQEQL